MFSCFVATSGHQSRSSELPSVSYFQTLFLRNTYSAIFSQKNKFTLHFNRSLYLRKSPHSNFFTFIVFKKKISTTNISLFNKKCTFSGLISPSSAPILTLHKCYGYPPDAFSQSAHYNSPPTANKHQAQHKPANHAVTSPVGSHHKLAQVKPPPARYPVANVNSANQYIQVRENDKLLCSNIFFLENIEILVWLVQKIEQCSYFLKNIRPINIFRWE